MILKQELSPQNGRYTPLLFFYLGKNEKTRISTHSAGSFFVNLLQLLSKIFYSKIASSRSHLLDIKRIILAYCLAHILFRNKTFLFVKIDSWNFQHLMDFSLFRESIEKMEVKAVWMSWFFVKFHEIPNQTDAENFSCLSWQTKKCYS